MDFASRIVTWQRSHGRHDLPWQASRDPYRIWLSEIMLQQTQVTTVIPYYTRFLDRFPTLASLAAAEQADVMPYWAGLGYYARARNLHRCAQQIVRDWGGAFPPDAGAIATLPGIGRSTAAAIAAFAYGHAVPIMDGNVKRVFTRHFGIAGDPGKREVENRLWALAQAQLGAGAVDMPAYTQGLMDLGATLCTRTRPVCSLCPVAASCVANLEGRQAELPTPKPRRAIPERSTALLILQYQDRLLLEHRPAPGIWGGLWSLPEFDPQATPQAACEARGATPLAVMKLAAFAHTFTHFRLHIQPWAVTLAEPLPDADGLQWADASTAARMALPAPIRKLVDGWHATGALAQV